MLPKHNHFITFSERPQLVEIKGETILEKVRYCHNYNEVANTDLQKVFERILRAAVKNRVPQSEMPSTLYIISDMEFDRCARGVALVSGCNPRIFSMLKSGILSPLGYMLDVLGAERYEKITA